MREPYALQQQDFDALLELFSDDRDEAGRAYEKLRSGLIRYFQLKGCSDSHNLADETLSRVASKASSFDRSLNIKPSSYAYGFASKIFLEYARSPRVKETAFEPSVHSPRVEFDDPGIDDDEIGRLEECLTQLSPEDRSLVLRYYSKEKQERIRLRKEMAAEMNCKPEYLHMRVFRLRETLRRCMDRSAKNI